MFQDCGYSSLLRVLSLEIEMIGLSGLRSPPN